MKDDRNEERRYAATVTVLLVVCVMILAFLVVGALATHSRQGNGSGQTIEHWRSR